MNSRSSLRRTQQWQLAEQQRYLSELEALGEKLRADIARLNEQIGEAGGEDGALPDRPLALLFVRPLIERWEKLQRSVGEIDAQIVDAKASLARTQQEARLVGGPLADRGFKFEDRVTRRTRRSM